MRHHRPKTRLSCVSPTKTSSPTLWVRVTCWLITGYAYTLACFSWGRCRFLPTCSAYALEVLHSHGLVKGTWLSLRRLTRCHPFSHQKGLDLPPKPERPPSSATPPLGPII